MLRPISLLIACLWTPALCAQSLNIDIGNPQSTAGGTPDTEPGAADQPGHWNLVGNSTNYFRSLRDLQNQPTSAQISLFIGSGNDYYGAGPATGGAGALLNDFMGPSTGLIFTFQGLEPGTYELTTYAWGPDFPSALTSVSPSNSYDQGSTNVGGNSWNGDYQEGVTHAVHTIVTPNGNLSVSINEVQFQATVNGFQLKKVAEIYENGCFGDGGVTPGCTSCPCGNDSFIPGLGGCQHSANGWGRLRAWHSSSVSQNTLRFDAVNLPPQTFAILTSGASRTPTNPANPCFGLGSGIQAPVFDGLRCVAEAVMRHGTRPTDAAGKIINGWGGTQAGPPGGVAAQGGFLAGQTRHFQVVFRDLPSAMCGTGQNTTQAVTVPFLP